MERVPLAATGRLDTGSIYRESLCLACLMALLFSLTWGCRGSAESDLPSPAQETEASAEEQASTAAPTRARLDRAGLIFGVAHPEGMELIDRTQVSAQFVTTHSLDLLTDFYERELTNYRTTQVDDSVKFETPLSDRPDIYILPGEDGSYLVTYFRKGVEDDVAVGLGTAHEQLNRAAENDGEPQARRPSFPLGPMAPPGWEPEGGRPDVGNNQSLYEERFIEQDGETIRVLVPRESP